MSKKRSIKRFGKVVVSLLLVLCLVLPGQVHGAEVNDDISDSVVSEENEISEGNFAKKDTYSRASAGIRVSSCHTGCIYPFAFDVTNCVTFAKHMVPTMPSMGTTADTKYAQVNSFTPTVGSIAISAEPANHVSYVESVNGNLITTLNGGCSEYPGYICRHVRDKSEYYGYYVPNLPNDTTPPTISSVQVTDVTKDGYTVTCNVSDNVGVTSVKFPSWNTDIHRGEDAIWLTGTISGNTASVRVNIASLKSGAIQGNYMTHIYAYDAAGNSSMGAITSAYIDRTAPIISNVNVTNRDSTGYTVNCTVNDNNKVNRVQFPTWTLHNGQDDLADTWWTNSAVRGTLSGDQATFRVNISEHNNERGVYSTHIYVYDDHGNSTFFHAPDTDMDVIDTTSPEIKNVNVDIKGNAFILEFDIEDDNALGDLDVWINQLAFKETKIQNTFKVEVSGKKSYHYRSIFASINSYPDQPYLLELQGGIYQPVIKVSDVNGNKTQLTLDTIEFPITKQYTIKVGESIDLEAIFADRNFANPIKSYFKKDLTDEDIVEITDEGIVTGKNIGETVISLLNYKSGEGGACIIKVVSDEPESIPITEVTLNKSSLTLEKGRSTTLTATIAPSNTTDNKTITWSSSDTKIATVSNGIVKAVTAGTTTITATTSNGKKATCKITVTEQKITVGEVSSLNLKNIKAKKMKVTFKKVSGAKGYQVVYSTNKKFKTVNEKTITKNTVTLKKLEKKKKYYVKVRAYKLDSKGQKVYGKYCSPKTIKIKK